MKKGAQIRHLYLPWLNSPYPSSFLCPGLGLTSSMLLSALIHNLYRIFTDIKLILQLLVLQNYVIEISLILGPTLNLLFSIEVQQLWLRVREVSSVAWRPGFLQVLERRGVRSGVSILVSWGVKILPQCSIYRTMPCTKCQVTPRLVLNKTAIWTDFINNVKKLEALPLFPALT